MNIRFDVMWSSVTVAGFTYDVLGSILPANTKQLGIRMRLGLAGHDIVHCGNNVWFSL